MKNKEKTRLGEVVGLVHIDGNGVATYEVEVLGTKETIRVTKKEMKTVSIALDGTHLVLV